MIEDVFKKCLDSIMELEHKSEAYEYFWNVYKEKPSCKEYIGKIEYELMLCNKYKESLKLTLDKYKGD